MRQVQQCRIVRCGGLDTCLPTLQLVRRKRGGDVLAKHWGKVGIGAGTFW